MSTAHVSREVWLASESEIERCSCTSRNNHSRCLRTESKDRGPGSEFRIPHLQCLADPDRKLDSVPSIFKLYSLSAIYRVKFTDLLSLFGVNLDRLHEHQLSSPLLNTHLTTLEIADEEKTVSFPVRFDRGFDIDNTNLLSRMVEVWGEVPIALIR